MKKIRFNLGVKMIMIVTLGVIMVFSGFGMFRIYMEKTKLTEQLYSSGQERAVLIAESVANLIIAFDYTNIESLLNRMVKLQDVQKITVLGRNGKTMAESISADFNQQGHNLSFSSPVTFSDEQIGTVELTVSLDRYDKSMRMIYGNVAFAVFFAMTFFIVLMYFTVARFIVRPIARLSTAADQLAVGNYDVELPVASDDEMGVLMQAFSTMRASRKMYEARLQAVFDHSPDAFIQLDENGDIIDWNDKAEYIWGYGKAEVLAKNFSIILPDPSLGLNPGYRKCYQKSEDILGTIREVIGQRKDQSLFPLELRTSKVQFEHTDAYLVLARDITDRKENEIKLLNAMNEAEAANAAKSAFLSNMSHEIRTPMNSIIGMTGLVLKTHLDAKQHDFLNKIDYSANHLLKLINDILDFSKIEANKLELETMDFDLSLLFESLSHQLLHSAAAKNLKLEFVLDAHLHIPLRGDPMRISQILMNYITNAIKFTEKGVIEISGKLVEETAEGILARFDVKDKGIGLSQAEIDKLFQPFHQADTSTTRRYGGTGLGLAICKQLSELMGGAVGVESIPGQGSNFWVTVRLGRGDKIESSVATPALRDTKVLKGTTILLVEDNLFNQQVAVELLQDVGAIVQIANNGQEALDSLHEQRFDCVLMDVQMPVMDGLEATRRIRSDSTIADTCIIAMTANAGLEDKQRCFTAGMNFFVTKPVFAENLYAVIAQCLNINKPSAGSGETLLASTGSEADAGMVQFWSPQEEPEHMQVIDLSVLGKMLGNDPAKINKFAHKFLTSANDGLVEIEAALNAGNLEKLAALGHRNKSPARTVGAYSYAELCQALEQFKQGGDIEQARVLVGKMKALMVKIASQIDKNTVT